jgi:cytidyltransferase-like protein
MVIGLVHDIRRGFTVAALWRIFTSLPQSILLNFQANILSIYLLYIMSKGVGEKAVRQRRIKIMVFGTFDGLHKGHLDFFKQARKLSENPYLIVSIARDKNVKKIKGQYSILNERKRVLLVKKSKLVDKVVLSGINNHLPHIAKEIPNIIALGYDQKSYIKNLRKDLKNKGILVKVVRLKPYKEKIYKNRLLKKKRGL